MIGMALSLIPACQLFGHASLCLALTNGGVHGLLLHRRAARSRDCCDPAYRTVRHPEQLRHPTQTVVGTRRANRTARVAAATKGESSPRSRTPHPPARGGSH